MMPDLKEVSKVKHQILVKYFPAWAKILGARNQQLVYVDCFAGEGRYSQDKKGSPLLILESAVGLCKKETTKFGIMCIFVEKNRKRADKLKQAIHREFKGKLPERVQFEVFHEDINGFIYKLLELIPEGSPSFFFIDPYGHPLDIPVMNEILERPKTEILLNLMWFSLNRHLGMKKMRGKIDRLFGHADWQRQPFMGKRGKKREDEFVDYFLEQLNAKYKLKFRIRFSPEDRVKGGSHRTKYYLVHLSNHSKAVNLMKYIMWKIGDEEGTFDYSAQKQGVLFSRTPQVSQLIEFISKNYVNSGRCLTFNELMEETYELPFIEKHYREAIKTLEKDGKIEIERVESKKSGVKGKDKIKFVAS